MQQTFTSAEVAIAATDAIRRLAQELEKAGVMRLADFEAALDSQVASRRVAGDGGVADALEFMRIRMR